MCEHGLLAGAGVEGRGQHSGRAGEVVGDGGQHGPGAVGGEPYGGAVGQRPALEVGDDLLNDRVVPVGGLRLQHRKR